MQCFGVEVLRVESFLVRALGPYLASGRVTGSCRPPKRGLNKAYVAEKLAISRLLESLLYIVDNMRVSWCNWNKPPLADPGWYQNLVGVKKFTEIPLASLFRWGSFCAARLPRAQRSAVAHVLFGVASHLAACGNLPRQVQLNRWLSGNGNKNPYRSALTTDNALSGWSQQPSP